MKFLTLLILLITASPALAATDTAGPWGVSVKGMMPTFGSFSSIVSAPATLGKMIVIDIPVTVNNKTISGRQIKVIPGASINVASGKTLTMPVPEAGHYQIFSGTGTVAFVSSGSVYPTWWGAIGDGVTDDTAAMEKWGLVGNAQITKHATKSYKISDKVTLRGQIVFDPESKIIVDGLNFPFGSGLTLAERNHVIQIGSESGADDSYDGTSVTGLTIEDTTAPTVDDQTWRTYLYVKYADNVVIRDLALIGLRSRNLTVAKETLNFERCNNLKIEGLSYTNCMSYRLALVVYCTNSSVQNVRAVNCFGRVVCIEASSEISVSNVIVLNATEDPIYLKGCNSLYAGQGSSNIYFNNIQLQGDMAYNPADNTTHNSFFKVSESTTNVQVRGMVIRGSSYYGMVIQGAHYVHIFDADINGIFYGPGIICWPHSTTSGYTGLRINNSIVQNNGTATSSAAIHLIGYLSPAITYVSTDIDLTNSEFTSKLDNYSGADLDISAIYTDAYVGTVRILNCTVRGRGRGIYCLEMPQQLIISGGYVSSAYTNGTFRPLIQATKFTDWVSGPKNTFLISGTQLEVPTTFTNVLVNTSCDVGGTAYIASSIISSVLHNSPTGAAPFTTTGNIVARKENNVNSTIATRTLLTDGNDF